MKYSYFPGCSTKGTARDYEASILEVTRLLGIELAELPDWNCCGASSAHMINEKLDVKLSARNLAQANEAGLPLMTPCAACYQRTRNANLVLKEKGAEYGMAGYEGKVAIEHLTGLLVKPENLEKIRSLVKHPLKGVKFAAYYGCLTNRPPRVTGAADYEQPRELDRIIEAVGGTAVSWSHRTECCGGSLTVARADIVRHLVKDIVNAARRGGAEAIVVDCAMCQANLESRQADLLKTDSDFQMLPVYFGTEIIAAALSEAGEAKWIKGHLLDASFLAGKMAELRRS